MTRCLAIVCLIVGPLLFIWGIVKLTATVTASDRLLFIGIPGLITILGLWYLSKDRKTSEERVSWLHRIIRPF